MKCHGDTEEIGAGLTRVGLVGLSPTVDLIHHLLTSMAQRHHHHHLLLLPESLRRLPHHQTILKTVQVDLNTQNILTTVGTVAVVPITNGIAAAVQAAVEVDMEVSDAEVGAVGEVPMHSLWAPRSSPV